VLLNNAIVVVHSSADSFGFLGSNPSADERVGMGQWLLRPPAIQHDVIVFLIFLVLFYLLILTLVSNSFFSYRVRMQWDPIIVRTRRPTRPQNHHYPHDLKDKLKDSACAIKEQKGKYI
jgi:hypothetical protein